MKQLRKALLLSWRKNLQCVISHSAIDVYDNKQPSYFFPPDIPSQEDPTWCIVSLWNKGTTQHAVITRRVVREGMTWVNSNWLILFSCCCKLLTFSLRSKECVCIYLSFNDIRFYLVITLKLPFFFSSKFSISNPEAIMSPCLLDFCYLCFVLLFLFFAPLEFCLWHTAGKLTAPLPV